MPYTSPSSLPAYDYLVELLSQTDDSDFIREILAALDWKEQKKKSPIASRFCLVSSKRYHNAKSRSAWGGHYNRITGRQSVWSTRYQPIIAKFDSI